MCAQTLVPLLFTVISKLLATQFKSAGNTLPARMAQRPGVYDAIRKRTAEHLAAAGST